jgi:hypothetical protein
MANILNLFVPNTGSRAIQDSADLSSENTGINEIDERHGCDNAVDANVMTKEQ